jgi:hypothetical protein
MFYNAEQIKLTTMMKSSRLWFAFLFLGFIGYMACRKIDRPNDVQSPMKENKFFNAHSTSDPIVMSARSFVKSQNDKYHFLAIS